MNVTLDQLRVLDAIERTGSFAGAAAALHKVPSAISYGVRGIEDGVGVPLFDRSRRKAELTAAGRQVLEAGRQVLERFEALEALSRQLRDGWEPELHVVVDGILPMGPITACLRRFAEADVPTQLVLDVEHREGVLHRFQAEQAQLALVLGFADDQDSDGFDTVPLPEVEMVLLAGKGHPLTAAPTGAEARNAHAELVVRDSSPDRAWRRRGSFLRSQTVVHLSDFHSKRLALLEGAGFGWMPLHLVADDLAQGRLVQLERTEGPSRWTYRPCVAMRQGVAPGRGAQLFLDTLTGA